VRQLVALLALCIGPIFAATAKSPAIDSASFDANVKPILKNTCSGCHNPTLTSGGVNLLPYLDSATLADDRASWEKIYQKIESGEMPPRGIPGPRHRQAPQPQ